MLSRYTISLLTLLWLLPAVMAGQGVVTLRLYEAGTSHPVVGAHVFNDSGRVIGVSDRRGECRLSRDDYSMQVRISHVSFGDTTLLLTTNCYIVNVVLGQKLTSLETFVFKGSPVNLIPDKPWYVSSYIHCPEGLLLLAYPQKMLSRQSLFLLDDNQEVLASVAWKEQAALVQDAVGDLWLKGKEKTWLVKVATGEVTIGEFALPTKEFEAGIERILLAAGRKYYFGHYSRDNQWLDYYCYHDDCRKTELLTSIADPLGMKLRETRHIFETNEFERRFGDMCFFAPVYAPVFNLGEELVMFALPDDEIRRYDSLNRLISTTPVTFHKLAGFKKQILYDKATGRFYALFVDRGITSLKEIAIESGKVIYELTVPSYPWIEQLSVYQDRVWFLYKEERGAEYRKIFMMPVGGGDWWELYNLSPIYGG
jgi:hypothetical protein